MLTPHHFRHPASRLVDAVRFLGAQGWCPATGGNFSTRVDDGLMLITRSGSDKRHLTEADLMLCENTGTPLDDRLTPSAETAVHARLYQLDTNINAVLHVHSVNNTLLSRHCAHDTLVVEGFEMQKALEGVRSHDTRVEIPVFDNTQDMPALANALNDAWQMEVFRVPGLLVRGHGLYAWGSCIEQARRHVEGFEFLFECLWQEKRLERSP
ncbi:MAG: methylthioribulose 1-phosphate dehydratase [Saccharospirillum sp.]